MAGLWDDKRFDDRVGTKVACRLGGRSLHLPPVDGRRCPGPRSWMSAAVSKPAGGRCPGLRRRVASMALPCAVRVRGMTIAGCIFAVGSGNLRAGRASMAGAPASLVRRDDSSCVRTAKLPFRQALMPVGDPTPPMRSGNIPLLDALLPSGRPSPAGRGPAPALGDPRSDPRLAFRGFDEPSRCLKPADWPAAPSRRTGQGSASPGRPRS